jgi:hypothetical protein
VKFAFPDAKSALRNPNSGFCNPDLVFGKVETSSWKGVLVFANAELSFPTEVEAFAKANLVRMSPPGALHCADAEHRVTCCKTSACLM